MNELQQCMRRFLQSEIPAGELAARAAQLAQTSERWAEMARQFEGIRGGGDG